MSAAAAAKSLHSCPTLCDPRDGSPPGSPVPGILQARTLEWVAISFSNAWNWKVKVNLSVVFNSSWPHVLQPTRLLRPWDLPGKSTGMGCHCLLCMICLVMDFLCFSHLDFSEILESLDFCLLPNMGSFPSLFFLVFFFCLVFFSSSSETWMTWMLRHLGIISLVPEALLKKSFSMLFRLNNFNWFI